MKAIIEKTHDREIIDAVTQFLILAEMSESAKLTISISRDAVSTLSYEIKEMPVTKGGE